MEVIEKMKKKGLDFLHVKGNFSHVKYLSWSISVEHRLQFSIGGVNSRSSRASLIPLHSSRAKYKVYIKIRDSFAVSTTRKIPLDEEMTLVTDNLSAIAELIRHTRVYPQFKSYSILKHRETRTLGSSDLHFWNG